MSMELTESSTRVAVDVAVARAAKRFEVGMLDVVREFCSLSLRLSARKSRHLALMSGL